MASAPKESVLFLKARLAPVARVRPEEVARLVAGLDDARYGAREQATRELERLEGQARTMLQHALSRKPSPEAAKRIKALLDAIDGPVSDSTSLRALRALELLERLGSPEAIALLQTLTGGAPDARLTREAHTAWQRLLQRHAKQS
jgi:hypothetical protein